MRLAVELGSAEVRLAAAADRCEAPWVLPGAPAASAREAVRSALRRLDSVLDPVEELIVVHPAHWSAPTALGAASRLAGPGVPVRTCSSALAAAREVTAREVTARAARPPGPAAVLQVTPAGVCATVLGSADGGPVLALGHTARTGGNDLIRALTQVTEAAGVPPCELTGGALLVAGASVVEQLIEPLTDLLGEYPVLPTDPDTVAVLGALRPAPAAATRPGGLSGPGPALFELTGAHRIEAASLTEGLVTTASPGRRIRGSGGAGGPLLAALVAAAVTGLGTGAFTGAGPPLHHSGGRSGADGAGERAVSLAQYDYTVRLPGGWRHSGGLPERRRTLLTPVGAPAGSDLIAIEQTPLGYDSAAEPDRAFRELRDRYARSVAGGAVLDEFTLATRVADRDVIAYRQRQPGLGAEVDWYVIFERDAQLSVGCQHTPGGVEAVRAACVEVVGSLRMRS
jgi:type VII secretion-associated protein (TIGR03931 family)